MYKYLEQELLIRPKSYRSILLQSDQESCHPKEQHPLPLNKRRNNNLIYSPKPP